MKNWSEHKPGEFCYNGKWISNWFSNMVITPFVIEGIKYQSVENYFQAQKSLDRADHLRVSIMPPFKAKIEGRKLKLRPDWEKKKESVMKLGLLAKFSQSEWKQKLIETGDEVIIEWNNWNDQEWGVTVNSCEGNNKLGLLLMEIREYFLTGK